MQKNHLIDLQEHFERYCNVLPVLGFNSAKYDINLIKSYLLPILVNERDIEPTVIKKANQFVSFKFGDIQILDIMNFLGGATSFDSFPTLTRPKRQRVSLFTYGLIVQRKKTTVNILRMTPSLGFCATATPLKKITTTLKRQWSSYEWIEYLRQVLKISRIQKASGRIITGSISRISSSGVTIKMLIRHWR